MDRPKSVVSYTCTHRNAKISSLQRSFRVPVIGSLLMSEHITSLNSLKGQKEGMEISVSIWSKMIGGIYSSSICMKHAVMQFKIFPRLHGTKVTSPIHTQYTCRSYVWPLQAEPSHFNTRFEIVLSYLIFGNTYLKCFPKLLTHP